MAGTIRAHTPRMISRIPTIMRGRIGRLLLVRVILPGPRHPEPLPDANPAPVPPAYFSRLYLIFFVASPSACSRISSLSDTEDTRHWVHVSDADVTTSCLPMTL